jgi:hypothetical protein
MAAGHDAKASGPHSNSPLAQTPRPAGPDIQAPAANAPRAAQTSRRTAAMCRLEMRWRGKSFLEKSLNVPKSPPWRAFPGMTQPLVEGYGYDSSLRLRLDAR